MRTSVVLLAVMATIFSGRPAWSQGHADVIRSIEQLTSPDRMTRYKAARGLEKAESLPEVAIDPIIAFLRLEVQEAMVPVVRPVQRIDALPLVGDELSLVRIKAEPRQFLDRPFIIAGGLQISNSYGGAFRKAADQFYSFNLSTVGADGQTYADGATVYMLRFLGTALAEKITRVQERTPGRHQAVRIRCIIRSELVGRDASDATSAIEATDWQTLAPDGKTWMPWTFESLRLGYDLLFKTGKPSLTRCLDLVMDEQLFENEKADLLLKGSAIAYFLTLPAKDRQLTFRRVPARAKRTKSRLARLWARRLQESLAQDQLVL